jgi:thiol-disulfide isomerase/thioredoxin
MQSFSRRDVVNAGVAGLIGLAGCLGGETDGDGQMDAMGDGPTTDSGTAQGADPLWYTATQTDVLSGDSFTLADLNDDRPVLLETFAVWCSNCLRQQKELRTFHDEVGDSVTTVALDVDPNEDAATVREHATEHGFDWRYAVASTDVTQSLVSSFGRSITVPPQVPMVLLCPGGDATRLENGHKSTEFLVSTVDRC